MGAEGGIFRDILGHGRLGRLFCIQTELYEAFV
jgi:hypothetical protein